MIHTRTHPAPTPATPYPNRRLARPWPRFLAAVVALCCLLGAACNRDDSEKQPAATELAPADVFSKRAPQMAIPKARKILLIGDSLSISLGEQMERALSAAPGIDFVKDGTRSSGLTRPELVDWPAHLRELVSQGAPDVVVIMLGANDVMPVEGPDGSRVYFDSPDWPSAYAAKTRELVNICHKANPRVVIYWVGVPPMGEASLAQGVVQVNAALSAMCGDTPGCRFIAVKSAFADPAGRFTRHARDVATGETLPIRTADGVHVTESGAKLLAGVVLRTLADQEKLPTIAGVDELRTFARDITPVADVEAPPKRETPHKIKLSGKTYTVKKGDTFLGIARHLGVRAEDLAAANPDADPKLLSLGQSLRLPAKR